MLQNEVVDTHKIMNIKVSSNQLLNFKADDDVSSLMFVKDFVNCKGFESDSSIMNLIKHVKETQITDCYNRIIKLIHINIEDTSNIQYQKLQIDDCCILFVSLLFHI